VPALFGMSVGVFAIASTLFFFVHAAMEEEPVHAASRKSKKRALISF
jgi:hypothetical protein